MPRRTGNVREVQDARRAALVLGRVLGVVAGKPSLATIALRGIVRRRCRLKRLLRPASRAYFDLAPPTLDEYPR